VAGGRCTAVRGAKGHLVVFFDRFYARLGAPIHVQTVVDSPDGHIINSPFGMSGDFGGPFQSKFFDHHDMILAVPQFMVVDLKAVTTVSCHRHTVAPVTYIRQSVGVRALCRVIARGDQVAVVFVDIGVFFILAAGQ